MKKDTLAIRIVLYIVACSQSQQTSETQTSGKREAGEVILRK